LSLLKPTVNEIDADILEQAKELVRGAEVLPGGVEALAKRLQSARSEGRPLRLKFGMDPTSTDLHIGHAVVIRKLRRFQEFGHKVIILIGGFTAQIGDPSGRNATRPALTEEEVAVNAATYLNQIGVILDLAATEVVNNVDWLRPLSLNSMLKLAGTVTINQLLAKEAFGERLEKQVPVSFHELFYPLLQGYDSVALKADIEFGGTDQRFNILQGRELQPHYGQEPQLAILLPLLEGTDGVRKMSKSYDNYIALKDEPGEMFGKCMRIPDNLILKYFELATTFTGGEVDQIKHKLDSGSNPKDAKLSLAKQIVSQYHDSQIAEQELEKWQKIHCEKQLPDLEDIPRHKAKSDAPIFRILFESGLVSSTSEAKRLIKEGAVRYCQKVVTDPNLLPLASANNDPLDETANIIQVGRRKFCLLLPG
jgi:tyrosyl-tRNA synthetase